MSEIKSFEFGTKAAAKEKIAGSFNVDGQKFDVRVLKDASLAYLIATISDESVDPMKVVAHVINFTERALTKESAPRFEALVLGKDGGTGLELSQMMQLFQHILTIGSANPTGSAKGSSTPARRTGASSRAATH